MTDPPPQDDTTLARLALAGDRAAFGELARRYQSPLLRFARRSVGGDAEDVVQETFVKAFERLGQYRQKHAFKPWLFAIAYHETINHLRRRRVRTMETLTESEIDHDPADLAAAADEKTSLWSLAREILSDVQFAAVWLFYAEEMSIAEIARVQRRTSISVKVMLHRARATLARHLEATSFSDFGIPLPAGEL